MLKKFISAKQDEIEYLKNLQNFPPIYEGNKKKLSNILSMKKGIIAEYKRGSPSMGVINTDVELEDVINGYVYAGAIGVSVITERKFFYGDINFLNKLTDINVPILRKDFILHPLQIKYTSTTPASAILLIVKIFEDKQDELKNMIEYSYELNIEPVVEINNMQELKIAKNSGAKIILVNNRDLSTLKVDINTSKKLIKHKQDNEIWISASGIKKPHEAKEMFELGYNGCLVGTHFMKQKDPPKALKEFIDSLSGLNPYNGGS